MKILKDNWGTLTVYDTEHPELMETCSERPASAVLLLSTHSTTDHDFLVECFGKGHSILKDLNESYYYALADQQEDVSFDWRVNTMGLLSEIAGSALAEKMGILQQPMNIFKALLGEVAARALVLNDRALNKLMLRLSLYSMNDPTSEDFNPEAVNRYLSSPDEPSEVEQLRKEVEELKRQLEKKDQENL